MYKKKIKNYGKYLSKKNYHSKTKKLFNWIVNQILILLLISNRLLIFCILSELTFY